MALLAMPSEDPMNVCSTTRGRGVGATVLLQRVSAARDSSFQAPETSPERQAYRLPYGDGQRSASRRTVAWWPCQTTPPANLSAGWPEGCHSDAEISTGVAWFQQRLEAVTTAAPITHRLWADATIREFPFAAGSRSTAATLWQRLRAAGVRVIPTLWNDESDESRYNRTLLPKLRAAFANAAPLIEQLVGLAVDHDLDGWNLDFELGASEEVAERDGAELVHFVDLLATSLAQHGKELSLDLGTWGSEDRFDPTYINGWRSRGCPWGSTTCLLWNRSALAASGLHSAVDMSTYADSSGDPHDYIHFIASTGRMLDTFPCDKIALGLCPECQNHSKPLTPAQLQARFAVIEGLGACVRALWLWFGTAIDHPPWDSYLPMLRAFVAGGQMKTDDDCVKAGGA
eukprot:SAG11_NODE_788_length_7169_cov_1.889109_6_plen_401_part_00